MTETTAQYTTNRPMTNAERFNAITQPAQVIYLLTIRHLDADRSITVANAGELAERIGYSITNSQVLDAFREWNIAGLVEVKTSIEGIKFAFTEHELIGGAI